ncbi:hypothetical protein ACWEQL_35470 [Kitasatospora sp. NPDC004240]
MTTYPGADRVDVTPPAWAHPTSTVTDARGRTVALWQYRTPTATGNTADADVTTYAYTPGGQTSRRTNSSGNAWSYGYDLRGRQVSAADGLSRCGRAAAGFVLAGLQELTLPVPDRLLGHLRLPRSLGDGRDGGQDRQHDPDLLLRWQRRRPHHDRSDSFTLQGHKKRALPQNLTRDRGGNAENSRNP